MPVCHVKAVLWNQTQSTECATGWPDIHGRVFLIPRKTYLKVSQGTRTTRPCLSGLDVYMSRGKPWRKGVYGSGLHYFIILLGTLRNAMEPFANICEISWNFVNKFVAAFSLSFIVNIWDNLEVMKIWIFEEKVIFLHFIFQNIIFNFWVLVIEKTMI